MVVCSAVVCVRVVFLCLLFLWSLDYTPGGAGSGPSILMIGSRIWCLGSSSIEINGQAGSSSALYDFFAASRSWVDTLAWSFVDESC